MSSIFICVAVFTVVFLLSELKRKQLKMSRNPVNRHDCTAAIVGESAAADTVAYMQGYISSNRYGEEAVSYYAENPEETPVFDCFFINGLKLVTFNPDGTIMVELEDGTSETHSYDYIGTYLIGKDKTMEYMGQDIHWRQMKMEKPF